MIQGGEAGAPGLRVPGSRLAAVATGVRVLIGVELRAPGVYASKAGPAQGVEGAQPQAAAPGKARGWLPGSAGKCGVDHIPPIPAAVGTSGEPRAQARRLQLTHGDPSGFRGEWAGVLGASKFEE